MNRNRRTLLIMGLAVLAAATVAAMGLPYKPLTAVASELRQYEPTPTAFVPCLEVSDQAVAEGSIVVDRACASRRGWVAIYNDADGEPGEVVGMTLIPFGQAEQVLVSIDADSATQVLYAQLHQDLQEAEVFEETDVVEAGPFSFRVQLADESTDQELDDTPTATPAPVETTAVLPTPTPEPEAALPAVVPLLGLGILFLLGIGLLLVALVPWLRNR